MHNLIKTQGIILKAVPYKDFHRIVTLFSPDRGLVSLMVKGAFSAKKGSGGSTTPLTTVEVTYRLKNGSLHDCDHVDILDLHLNIRNNLQALDAACGMLRAVSQSQLPDKEAPLLYQLLLFYLGKLPFTQCPATLSSSFLLKTLRHEGLLMLPTQCEICGGVLKEVSCLDGSFVCRSHRRGNDVLLDAEEYNLMYLLTLCETHSQLAAVMISPDLKGKIERLFTDSLAHN